MPSTAIAVHLAAALAVLGLTGLQLALPKGTTRHRIAGYAWVSLMAVVALSSFAIPTFLAPHLGGFPFGPIHVLSVLMLAGLAVMLAAARRGDVAAHRRVAIRLSIIFVVTGAATLAPGRLLNRMLFG
jgi:uncharacterized membrane protein